MIRSEKFLISNWDGWVLDIKRSWWPRRLVLSQRPLILLPGFGNNARVFAYPDEEHSMEGFFAQRGREVWSINLRGQGCSKREGGSRNFGVQDMALTDLGRVLDFIAEHSLTSREQVDAIGASLGGTILYIHSAMRTRHRLASIVAIGSPLRWEMSHPVFAMAAKQKHLLGWVPVRGSRLFLKTAFPLLRRLPSSLGAYVDPNMLASPDISRLVETVDDPHRHLSKQVLRWIKEQDLIINGANVTNLLERSRSPLLCVLGNQDGIVPAKTALSAIKASGASVKDVLRVGDEEVPFGHADPFIHRHAPERVFQPIEEWLERFV